MPRATRLDRSDYWRLPPPPRRPPTPPPAKIASPKKSEKRVVELRFEQISRNPSEKWSHDSPTPRILPRLDRQVFPLAPPPPFSPIESPKKSEKHASTSDSNR